MLVHAITNCWLSIAKYGICAGRRRFFFMALYITQLTYLPWFLYCTTTLLPYYAYYLVICYTTLLPLYTWMHYIVLYALIWSLLWLYRCSIIDLCFFIYNYFVLVFIYCLFFFNICVNIFVNVICIALLCCIKFN